MRVRNRTFAQLDFARHRKQTRRARFLEEMEQAVPWQELVARLAPVYPKGERGRPPVGLERMLRIYFMQQWFALSDRGMEDELNDSFVMCRFARVDLGRERAPDATTLLKFRRLLERHGCGEVILEVVRRHLASRGVVVNRGTIMDATIVPAARSRKNRARSRDPEMRATRKGNQGYFGLKAHIGADARTKQVHSVATTAANVHDSQQIGALLHGEETRVWGDKAYTNQTAAIRAAAPRARDLTLAKAERNRPLTARQLAANRAKSRVRARVEHPFGVLKGVFGYVKVRYRGLAKNDHQLRVLFALVNVYMFRHALIAAAPATR